MLSVKDKKILNALNKVYNIMAGGKYNAVWHDPEEILPSRTHADPNRSVDVFVKLADSVNLAFYDFNLASWVEVSTDTVLTESVLLWTSDDVDRTSVEIKESFKAFMLRMVQEYNEATDYLNARKVLLFAQANGLDFRFLNADQFSLTDAECEQLAKETKFTYQMIRNFFP